MADDDAATPPGTPAKPFEVSVRLAAGGGCHLEFRPRAGAWDPFFVAMPQAELDQVRPGVLALGPRGQPPPADTPRRAFEEGETPDGRWWYWTLRHPVTPETSGFLACGRSLPTRLLFGVADGEPQYEVTFPPPGPG